MRNMPSFRAPRRAVIPTLLGRLLGQGPGRTRHVGPEPRPDDLDVRLRRFL